MAEALEGKKVDFKLLATDISTKVLAQAREGVYKKQALESVPRMQFHKYFIRQGKHQGEPTYQVSPELRSEVVFKRLNLSQPPFPMRGPLDVVFCRNVMIYFDNPVRQRLISAIEQLLGPDGLLFIGHTETLHGIQSHLKTIRPSMYMK